jgi:HlyD family secretion protein
VKKIAVFTLLAVLLVGIPLLSKITGGGDAKQVELAEVELKLIKRSILASGTLAYREQVQLRPEVIGQVIALHVEEADRVAKGQLVITLDPKSYQARVDQAAARVRIQESAIERQRLLLQNLEERFERQRALYQSKLVDEDSFEVLENQLALARWVGNPRRVGP